MEDVKEMESLAVRSLKEKFVEELKLVCWEHGLVVAMFLRIN